MRWKFGASNSAIHHIGGQNIPRMPVPLGDFNAKLFAQPSNLVTHHAI
jgi:hypothetical protein